MITGFIARIFGTKNERELKYMQPLVAKINALESTIAPLSDEQLCAKTNEFRQRISKGETLDSLLPEAYAVVREASKRKLGQRHYDVQLIGGIVLHQGRIAEMKTGEGKTLTATLPLYLNALAGKGAHLVTVNDYLASRDAAWMAPIYNALGLEVACLRNAMNDAERQKAYAADILYATNNELGFDYLRDNMKFRSEDFVQRPLFYGIVDEVDSILIDEARTPLIISGSGDESSELYGAADRVVKNFKVQIDYEVDEKARSVQMTEHAMDKVERAFNITNLYAMEHLNLLHHVRQALRAHTLFKRDVDYMVHDDEVLIVDEFTGRVLPGRRYSDGLHQALEAKEGVKIERESQTLASITLQNFFRLYKKLSGMTGTAVTEAEEFHNIYRLDVVAIPTNEAVLREDRPDLIFLNKMAKYKAIVQDVKERHQKGQPVLIGTVAIETSELLSQILSAEGIPHEVLNAKQHAREAEIIEHAGQAGRVMIATNMAGRGTDIKLTQESKEQGGLYILGTERHESRRIDNQLRGRSGRQGDPGESRFYISLEDDLIRIFAGDTLKRNMERFGMKEDEIIESRFVSRTIERAQEKVEKHNFEIRKHLLEYDDVLNQQRSVIYAYRRDALEGENRIFELVRDFVARVVEDVVIMRTAGGKILNAEIVDQIYHDLDELTSSHYALEDFKKSGINTTSVDMMIKDLINFLWERYELYRNSDHKEVFQSAEKWLLLETIDQAWKQHMLNLDHLKEGISLRSWGQQNPLIEYKREAFAMFEDMLSDIQRMVFRHIFHLNIDRFDEHALEQKRERELDELNMVSGKSDDEPQVPVRHEEPKVGRNDMCPCGSELKYKKCHGQK